MTDIAQSPNKMQTEELGFLSPTSESMLQKLGGSINYILDKLEGSVIGTIEASLMTESQYQTAKGSVSWPGIPASNPNPPPGGDYTVPTWILADGREITGSALAVAIGGSPVYAPDLRGMFLRDRDRGVGVNPAGDNPEGTFQMNGTAEHHHKTTLGNNTGLPVSSLKNSPTDSSSPHVTGANGGTDAGSTRRQVAGTALNFNLTYDAFGAAESAPYHAIINWFIRIN
jgi:hypothetical protein